MIYTGNYAEVQIEMYQIWVVFNPFSDPSLHTLIIKLYTTEPQIYVSFININSRD